MRVWCVCALPPMRIRPGENLSIERARIVLPVSCCSPLSSLPTPWSRSRLSHDIQRKMEGTGERRGSLVLLGIGKGQWFWKLWRSLDRVDRNLVYVHVRMTVFDFIQLGMYISWCAHVRGKTYAIQKVDLNVYTHSNASWYTRWMNERLWIEEGVG